LNLYSLVKEHLIAQARRTRVSQSSKNLTTDSLEFGYFAESITGQSGNLNCHRDAGSSGEG